MHDDPTQAPEIYRPSPPMDPATGYPAAPSPSNPEVDAIEIAGEAVSELVAAVGQLPAQPGHAEALARIFDRISEDVAEAAVLIRRADARRQRFLP